MNMTWSRIGVVLGVLGFSALIITGIFCIYLLVDSSSLSRNVDRDSAKMAIKSLGPGSAVKKAVEIRNDETRKKLWEEFGIVSCWEALEENGQTDCQHFLRRVRENQVLAEALKTTKQAGVHIYVRSGYDGIGYGMVLVDMTKTDQDIADFLLGSGK